MKTSLHKKIVIIVNVQFVIVTSSLSIYYSTSMKKIAFQISFNDIGYYLFWKKCLFMKWYSSAPQSSPFPK